MVGPIDSHHAKNLRVDGSLVGTLNQVLKGFGYTNFEWKGKSMELEGTSLLVEGTSRLDLGDTCQDFVSMIQ